MTSEDLYEEIQTYLAEYSGIIKNLRNYKLADDQINKVLLLIYQYRLMNALDGLEKMKIANK